MPLGYGKLLICCICYFSAHGLNSLFRNSFQWELLFIGTSQPISVVDDLACFCLISGFTELNLQTHLRAIFVLCVPFYMPAFVTSIWIYFHMGPYFVVVTPNQITVSKYKFTFSQDNVLSFLKK